MAAAGTGLPSQRGQVATTITDTAGYGAGEAAAAEAFARAADGLGRIMDRLEPSANEAAKAIAEQEVAAGNFEQRIVLTGADAAYNNAMRTGRLAQLSNDADRDLDALRAENLLNPDGYRDAAANLRRAALENSIPGELAVAWATDFDRRSNGHLSVIRNARAAADLDEAKAGLTTRLDNLISETVNIRPGAALADVMADDQVQANILQITRGFDELANNPAFGVSAEEADAKRTEAMQRIAAGAVSAWAVDILRREGSDAALGALQGVLTDEAMGDRDTRQLAFTTAREAVNQELNLTNQRRGQQASERAAAEQDLARLVDEDVAQVELTGEGTGLTADQVRAVAGNAGVSAWLKRRADAAEFNGLVGSLPLNDPDAAAAQITSAVRARSFDAALPAVADDADMNTMVAAISQVESGNRDGLVSGDPDGAGPAGGGAYGRMQVLPDTARRIAAQLGLPFDINRLRNDGAYNQQIGRAYLGELMQRYGGDSFLAITAYHAGPGFVDAWIKPVGQSTTLTVNGRRVEARGRGDPRSGQTTREAWLASLEANNPRSAAYPRKVLAAMNAGRANAAWDAYRSQRTAQQQDPAQSVARDFPVRAASDRWRENPTSTPAAEAYVTANLASQERANIAAGQRRTLPNASLVVYAAELNRFADANDTAGFQGYADQLTRRFGRHGADVLQDVLEVRGDTRFAAQIAARVTARAAGGLAPTRQDVAQADTARRASTMQGAAAGAGGSARELTDAQLLAQLGGSPLGD